MATARISRLTVVAYVPFFNGALSARGSQYLVEVIVRPSVCQKASFQIAFVLVSRIWVFTTVLGVSAHL